MATVIIPAHEVKACDLCNKGNRLEGECIVCGADYCYMCSTVANFASPYVSTCKRCAKANDVQTVIRRHEPIIQVAISARGDDLRSLRKDARHDAAHREGGT